MKENAASSIHIERWNPEPSSVREDIERLGEVLHACVHAGASVSFILPFSQEEARAFWRDQVLPAVNSGGRRVVVARLSGRIVGTVQLDLDTPPNQPHRAEVKKLLVHPDARLQGIARSLMAAIEVQAREAGRALLTLDAVSGGAAEQLYLSAGYVAVGVIPRYALNFTSTKLEDTTVMCKELSSPPDGRG